MSAIAGESILINVQMAYTAEAQNLLINDHAPDF